MKKMPPLPNRKNQKEPPSLELVSNRVKMPQRYNSIQRVIREAKDEYQENNIEQRKQNKNISNRENIMIRRPYSAKQISASRGRSIDSRGSVDSKQSLGSRGKSYRRRQSPHYNMKMRVSMPSVTAHSWVLYEMKQEKFVYGKANFKKRQIASLTKIMNLVTILRLLDKQGLIASKIRLNVTKQACTLIGTTAMLKPSIELSLEDLFYGMMLPSGNDAAHQVAQVGGTILALLKEGPLDKNIVYNCQQLSYLMNNTANIVGIYLHEMNMTARKLDLTRSSWANPHGLSNVNNISTAQDMAKLCMYAMKNSQFREVVSTKNYNCVYFYDKQNQNGESQIQKDVLKWENTNKMLWEGWTGIKTGITPNAGPCLAASCKRMLNGREFQFLVILIKSQSMEARWGQVRKLVDWIILGNWFFPNN